MQFYFLLQTILWKDEAIHKKFSIKLFTESDLKVFSTSQNEFILRNLFKFQFIVLIVKYNGKATCLTYLHYLKINIPVPESRNLQYFAVLYIRGLTSL